MNDEHDGPRATPGDTRHSVNDDQQNRVLDQLIAEAGAAVADLGDAPWVTTHRSISNLHEDVLGRLSVDRHPFRMLTARIGLCNGQIATAGNYLKTSSNETVHYAQIGSRRVACLGREQAADIVTAANKQTRAVCAKHRHALMRSIIVFVDTGSLDVLATAEIPVYSGHQFCLFVPTLAEAEALRGRLNDIYHAAVDPIRSALLANLRALCEQE
jgi:hypothetical protein